MKIRMRVVCNLCETDLVDDNPVSKDAVRQVRCPNPDCAEYQHVYPVEPGSPIKLLSYVTS